MSSALDVRDVCIVSGQVNHEWADEVVESQFPAGSTITYLVRAQHGEPAPMAAATHVLMSTLLAVGGDAVVVVSARWADSPLETLAVAAAANLGLDTRVYDGSTLRPVGEADPHAAMHHAAAGSPDENRDERPHEEAARIVLGPRGAYYDHPYDNFMRTGHIWTGILYSKMLPGQTVSPEDVALCMVGVKMAREAFRHKRDNLTDAHGYLLTHEMVLDERERRERDSD